MQSLMAAERRLDLLDTRVRLNISINDLRIVLNCFRALDYLGRSEDEPYLDREASSLKQRLESSYKVSLARFGM